MKLIRFLLTFIALIGFGYFAFTVPLGEKTLWEHIKAIAETKESKDLVEEAKQKAQEVKDKAQTAFDSPKTQSQRGHEKAQRQAEEDQLTAEDRKILKKLIRKELAKERAAKGETQ